MVLVVEIVGFLSSNILRIVVSFFTSLIGVEVSWEFR